MFPISFEVVDSLTESVFVEFLHLVRQFVVRFVFLPEVEQDYSPFVGVVAGLLEVVQ